jgi:hypothetical protein
MELAWSWWGRGQPARRGEQLAAVGHPLEQLAAVGHPLEVPSTAVRPSLEHRGGHLIPTDAVGEHFERIVHLLEPVWSEQIGNLQFG